MPSLPRLSPISRRGAAAREAPARAGTGELRLRALPAYCDHLAVERGLSPASVEAYRRDLEAFGAWLEKAGEKGRPDRRALSR
ncbi:MAG: site-specific integrase, partial [Thermoanaerobaculia bacterium]